MHQPVRIPNTRTAGLLLAVVTAVVSGFAVFLNSYGVRAWTDAGASSAAYTTVKNLVAAVALGAIALLAARRARAPRERLTRGQRQRLALIGILGGGVPFLLFFEGLARASSTQAAFIHKTLLVWVALLAVPFLAEKVSALHLGAMALLVGGQAAITGVGGLRLGTGEAMILGATLLWAVEVVVAKRVLADVPAATVGVARMGIGALVLVGWTAVSGGFAALAGLTSVEWGWVLLTGATLAGYVGSWYGALSRARALDVTAVLVFGAVVTALLDHGIRGLALPPAPGLALVGAGTVLAALAARRAARQRA